MGEVIKRKKEKYVHLLMFLCSVLVSTSFPVGEHIADALDPAVITLIRFIAAALFLMPVIAVRFGLRVSGSSLVRYCLISGCLVTFFWCMFFSLRYTTALNTSVLFTLVPALSFIYSAIIVKEQLGRKRVGALLLGFIGALWVIFKGDINLLLALSWNRGDVIFFIGCLAMGMYTPLIKLLHREEPMEVMTFWILVTGIVWLLPIGGLELTNVDWGSVQAETWGWIIYLAFFTTVVSFYLTQFSTPIIGPTRVMAYSYLYPALVLLLDILIGNGWPVLQVFPGLGFILVSMVILQMPKSGGQLKTHINKD